jgi:DNA replication protein DnaC
MGTGKTHFAIALDEEATRQKRRILFTRAADVVRQLRDAREPTRFQHGSSGVDVLTKRKSDRMRKRRAAEASA